jgi:hypothetical protein
MVARKKGVPLNEDALIYMLKKKYPAVDNSTRTTTRRS